MSKININSLTIRKGQRIFSILVLLGITVLVSPYISSGIERSLPEEKEQGATKLLVVHEGYQVELERPWHLIIKAVNDGGVVDKSRNNIIKLNVTSISYLKSRSELDTYTIRLENGTATVHFIGHAQEVIRLTATCIDCKSALKPAVVHLNVGVGGE